MRNLLRPIRKAAGRSGGTAPLGVCFLCVAVFAGQTLAQANRKRGAVSAPEATAKPQDKDAGKAAVRYRVIDKDKPLAVRKGKAKTAAKAIRKIKNLKPMGKTRQVGSQFTKDPNAKWVCDQPVAALDPVWRGAKNLTFNFEIRNAGTADLKIKARGG